MATSDDGNTPDLAGWDPTTGLTDGVTPKAKYGDQPEAKVFEPTRDLSKPYGFHVPYNRGFGVRFPDRRPRAAGTKADNWSARLTDPGGQFIDLWVEEVESSFEVAGSTAQSRFTRQWFPHNFVQPVIRVTGRVANSYEYNRLALFVRNSHDQALRAEDTAFVTRKYAGTVVSRHTNQGWAIPTVEMILRSNVVTGQHNVKGRHKPWVLEGYIKSMPAGAKRFDTAPQFTFEYVIAASKTFGGRAGLYDDKLVAGREILSWMEVFQRNNKRWGGQGYVKDPDTTTPEINSTAAAVLNDDNLTSDVGNFLGAVTQVWDLFN